MAKQAVLTHENEKLYPITYDSLVVMHGSGKKLAAYFSPERLKGKKWLGLGDSYTHGLHTYFTDLASSLGMTYYNYGIVSSTICQHTDAASPMVDRWDNMEADNVGLITFMGGANDWTSTIGTMDDDSTTKTSIYGACKNIFEGLIAKYPDALIIVILQPENNKSGNIETDISNMRSIEEAVKNVAELYNLDILDMCTSGGMTVRIPEQLSLYWQADKLHLTAAGNENLVRRLERKILESC